MAGYSGTPLQKKLGLKEGFRALLIHEPHDYQDLLGNPPGIEYIQSQFEEPLDFVHLFADSELTLHRDFPPLKDFIKKDGMIWVSWIKGASKLNTDITGNEVHDLGLQLGLVDVKVCAFDEDWSALKFMYRKEDR